MVGFGVLVVVCCGWWLVVCFVLMFWGGLWLSCWWLRVNGFVFVGMMLLVYFKYRRYYMMLLVWLGVDCCLIVGCLFGFVG